MEPTRTLKGHEGWVTAVAFSPAGKWLVSGGEDKTLRLWEVETGKELAQLKGHESAVSAVDVSPDGKQLVSGHRHPVRKAGNRKAHAV